jgi:hypothetical protein
MFCYVSHRTHFFPPLIMFHTFLIIVTISDYSHISLSMLALVEFQLDAQNAYLFICNTFIKILYNFRALPCSSSGGLRRNRIYAASGIVTVCRWLSCAPVKKELKKEFFLNRCTTCSEWRYQRLHICDYDLDLLKMSRVMLKTCKGF